MTIKEFKMQYALGTLSYNEKIEFAMGNNTPKAILTILSDDENWSVRYWTGKNINTTIKILKKLAKDKEEAVRQMVAMHRKTPRNILIQLSTDKTWVVQYNATENLTGKLRR